MESKGHQRKTREKKGKKIFSPAPHCREVCFKHHLKRTRTPRRFQRHQTILSLEKVGHHTCCSKLVTLFTR